MELEMPVAVILPVSQLNQDDLVGIVRLISG